MRKAMYLISYCFFFSSRRRHTRCLSDWSSDVCSSDLTLQGPAENEAEEANDPAKAQEYVGDLADYSKVTLSLLEKERRRLEARIGVDRSEERRVGKECRCRG